VIVEALFMSPFSKMFMRNLSLYVQIGAFQNNNLSTVVHDIFAIHEGTFEVEPIVSISSGP
jgi:hypothetical protein